MATVVLVRDTHLRLFVSHLGNRSAEMAFLGLFVCLFGRSAQSNSKMGRFL